MFCATSTADTANQNSATAASRALPWHRWQASATAQVTAISPALQLHMATPQGRKHTRNEDMKGWQGHKWAEKKIK